RRREVRNEHELSVRKVSQVEPGVQRPDPRLNLRVGLVFHPHRSQPVVPKRARTPRLQVHVASVRCADTPRHPMTPAQMEEASARIEDREYYASVAPHLHAIASDLLAEVKRLREALEWSRTRLGRA